MFNLIAFAVLTLGLLVLSMPSLGDRHSHGFYRFFAFEALVGVTLVNRTHWFETPTAPHQIVSWLLLAGSAGLALHGFFLLRKIGRPEGGIEATTTLVRVGAYRLIRHPLYASLLMFGWGAFVKSPTIVPALLVTVLTAFLISTARVEEVENARKFGQDYLAYMRDTKMFIPYVF